LLVEMVACLQMIRNSPVATRALSVALFVFQWGASSSDGLSN
jgi:hypothetical protein